MMFVHAGNLEEHADAVQRFAKFLTFHTLSDSESEDKIKWVFELPFELHFSRRQTDMFSNDRVYRAKDNASIHNHLLHGLHPSLPPHSLHGGMSSHDTPPWLQAGAPCPV